MKSLPFFPGLPGLLGLLALATILRAGDFPIEVSRPEPPSTEGFQLGSGTAPDGSTIGTNSRHLTRDGQPWMPVMGEFHFARCPEDEWREELLRMRAGGVDIAATYVFWIHHEEEEGVWRWDGRRNLRRFVELCRETGMLASVRLGPWCHGEVRNGGIPDWALDKDWKLRSNDPAYLGHVAGLYGEIARQLDGLLWKDGGPVVAVQVENEYRGRGEHLLRLKRIAREAGLDVPIYTRTGWPALATPVPYGEILPLFGAYAEGFWDRQLRSMPGKYWAAFRFLETRTDAAIATEQLGERAARDEADAHRYPYLTCELGGGMVSSYHRRIFIQPDDVESVALVKVGSGGNLPGYYMYHGGVNPEGRLTTLNENQATRMTNYNDMPVKNYDFQAPLGSFGQVRPHYHGLRRLHLMCRDFGGSLATMPAFLPATLPGDPDDTSTLRFAARSDGRAGFLFVNNHQRGAAMPEHEDVRFRIDREAGPIEFPAVRIRPGAGFIWPFDLDLGRGVRLEWATAQPVAIIDEDDRRTLFLAATGGIDPVIKLAGQAPRPVAAGRGIAHSVDADGGAIRFVVLGESDSRQLWKGTLAGRERVVLSPADLTFDRGRLQLRAEDPARLRALCYPPIGENTGSDGLFGEVALETTLREQPGLEIVALREAGQAREVPLGPQKVAVAPADEDFAGSAAWRITFPDGVPSGDCLLRVRYEGDVARVLIDAQLVFDDYYNGRPLELGLRRHAERIRQAGGLTLQILPLPAGAPIHLPAHAGDGPLLELHEVRLVPRHRASSTPAQ